MSDSEDATLEDLRRLAELRVDRFMDSEASRASRLESLPPDLRAVIDPEYALAELRASRSLLADLREHGYPVDHAEGDVRCSWCRVLMPEEHGAMADGKPCFQIRIEQASPLA